MIKYIPDDEKIGRDSGCGQCHGKIEIIRRIKILSSDCASIGICDKCVKYNENRYQEALKAYEERHPNEPLGIKGDDDNFSDVQHYRKDRE